MEKTVDGVTYVSKPEESLSSCDGCAGRSNEDLCIELRECAEHLIIWTTKEKQTPMKQSTEITLRDYFIAHAPAVPQPWFQPDIPPMAEPDIVLSFVVQYPDHTEAEDRAISDFDSEWMNEKDVKEPRVRDYLFRKKAFWNQQQEHDRMVARERLLQWPAAWADEMLARREKGGAA